MRLTAFPLFAAVALAGDWTTYRGPNGTGIASDTALPSEAGKDKNVVWKVKAPKGNSSPIVVRNRVYFTGHEGAKRMVVCYDADTGKELWTQSIEKQRDETAHPLNGPTTPTLATDGKSVFAFFPEFGLAAYTLDGKPRWKTPVGPFAAIQGIAASPTYVEGNVVVLIDTPEDAYLAAFDAKSGKQVWKTQRPVGMLGSYSTPVVYKPAKGPVQLIVSGALELTGYQAKTGEKLWWARGVTNGPAALPVIAGGAVYTMEPKGEGAPPWKNMAAAYDKDKNGSVELTELMGEKINDKIMYRLFKAIDTHGGDKNGSVTEKEWTDSFSGSGEAGGLIRTRLGGSGDVSKTHVDWRYTKGLPYLAAPLEYQGVLYVVRDGGILNAHDPATGKLLRGERMKDAMGEYYASPVAADGKVYFVSKDGKLSVIKAGEKWETLSTSDLDEQVIATPAIAGGRLFVRAAGTLYCFGAV